MERHDKEPICDGPAETWSRARTEFGALKLTQLDVTAKTDRAFEMIAEDGTVLIDRDLLPWPPMFDVPSLRPMEIVEQTVALPQRLIETAVLARPPNRRPVQHEQRVVAVVTISWGAGAVGAVLTVLFSACATLLALSVA